MTRPAWLAPVRLGGTHATLEPLAESQRDGLAAAAADGALWQLWYASVPRPEAMAAEIARRLEQQAAGTMLPFAVLDAGGRVVGMTSFLHADATHRRVEIGGTWIAAGAQRGPLNTECKLMLLGHAFETLDCIAVELRTHFLNQQSRRAIERIGARLDGILRHHQRLPDGTLRDTCVYSIVRPEWPAVRTHLRWLLARPR